MEYWEFLLQKEGDRSWLPLESSSVEILEGRYRVVARSSRANANVEVRVSHQTVDEIPPKRRLQKRHNRTNQDGLMVVIPFTRLKPGIWELRCTGDLMSDLLGNGWQYKIQLQVLPQDLDPAGDWDLDWDVDPEPETEIPSEAVSEVVDAVSDQTLEPVEEAAAALSPETEIDHPEEEFALPDPEPAIAENPVEQIPQAELPAISVEPLTPPEPEPVTEFSTPAAPSTGEADYTRYSIDRLLQIAEQMSQQLVDEVLQDIDAADEAASTDPVSTAPVSPASEQFRQAPATSHSEDLPLENLDDFDASVVFTEAAAESVPEIASSAIAEPPIPLQITLTQETYMARWGHPLFLVGRIEPVEPTTTPGESGQALQAAELQVNLRDPQTSAVVVQVSQSLPAQIPPISFSCSCTIPSDCASRLLLGDLYLYADTPGEPHSLLATQSFTITADLNEILGAIVDELDEEDFLDLSLEPSPPAAKVEAKPTRSAPLNSVFVDLGKSRDNQAPRFQPSISQPIPPQIRQPASESGILSPQLPVFPTAQPAANLEPPATDVAAEIDNLLEEVTAPEVDDAISADLNADLNADLDEAIDLANLDLDQPDDPDAELEPFDDAELGGEIPLLSAAPVENDFKSLNLQDRFWSRLNALATDAELSEWLKINLTEASPEEDLAPEAPVVVEAEASPEALHPDQAADEELSSDLADTAALLEPITDETADDALFDPVAPIDSTPLPEALATEEAISTEAALVEEAFQMAEEVMPPAFRQSERDSTAHEIVVEDELPRPNRFLVPTTPEPPAALILPADQPVPTPMMEISAVELTAGRAVTVQVKLPNLPSRIYVKLWVQDRQTRSLLDGPRWLVDFAPNGLGDVEAYTQLTIPFGCLEIQFEAIAVEMHTQRESHKVTIDRMVIPPDLPHLSLDDFEA